MKTMQKMIFSISALGIAALLLAATPAKKADLAANEAVQIRTINFKSVVEASKYGKKEQASFEALKKQMENVLEEKEKELSDLNKKFEDPDYLDSLTAEAETELKRKFRQMGQEFTSLQNQYLQALNQTNYKIVQKLQETVAKAAKDYAKENNVSAVFNQEACFFASDSLDVSKEVVAVLDSMFEQDVDAKASLEQK